MNDFFTKFKYRKKFRRSQLILEGLAILQFGMDENTLLEELKIQEDHLKKFMNIMMKTFHGKDLAPIWLVIDGDYREHFIKNYRMENSYSIVLVNEGLFALIKYFDHHPTAAKIILEYMENKKGFKVEKNFYVNLVDLPQKSHYFGWKSWNME